MNVTIPDSLKDFVERQVNTGRYANTDAFIEDLIRTEAQVLERIGKGDTLPVDEALRETFGSVARRSGG